MYRYTHNSNDAHSYGIHRVFVTTVLVSTIDTKYSRFRYRSYSEVAPPFGLGIYFQRYGTSDTNISRTYRKHIERDIRYENLSNIHFVVELLRIGPIADKSGVKRRDFRFSYFHSRELNPGPARSCDSGKQLGYLIRAVLKNLITPGNSKTLFRDGKERDAFLLHKAEYKCNSSSPWEIQDHDEARVEIGAANGVDIGPLDPFNSSIDFFQLVRSVR